MNYGFVRVAVATPRIRVADPAYNQERIREKIGECLAAGAGVIVLPELCLSGFTCQDLFLENTLLEECRRQLGLLAEGTKEEEALIFVGLPWKKEGKLYNVAAALNRGRVLALVPKTHLPNYGEFYEARQFTAGKARMDETEAFGYAIPFGSGVIFQARGWEELKVGCEICEDLWVPAPPSTALACEGATVLVNLSASNETLLKAAYRKNLIQSTSARLAAAYAYASAGAGESTQDMVFAGHNMIAENGKLLAEGKPFRDAAVYADVDIDRLAWERRRMNTYPAPEGKYMKLSFSLKITAGQAGDALRIERPVSRHPFVPGNPREREGRCEGILTMQAQGLKQRLAHTGYRHAVIGLSGGLDSALALLVTVRAFDSLGLDRRGIHSLTMPCFGTTGRTYENACRLARILGTAFEEVDIREAVELHFRDIGQDRENRDVTYENSQARERTQVLMDVANREGGLVIGTGDLSELALGWATYNGDHMSMYGVNAGVPKTLVRHLVHYFAMHCGETELTAALSDILDTPVSPELLPPAQGEITQKTEDLIGPYELHDFFLYYLLRWGFSPAKIYALAQKAFRGEYESPVILHWLEVFFRRFFSQQFKRSCLPDGPKVGSVALSPRGDWRMPSDASAALWLQEVERLKG